MDGFEKEDRLSSSLASGHQGPQGRAAAGCLHPESHVPGQCVCRQVRELWLALANTGPVGLCLVLGMWCVSVSLVLLSFFSHIFGRHLSQAPISTSGEDSLEEGAFFPWGNPNNKEQMTINKVEHGSLLSWILTLIPQRGPYLFL